MNIALIVGASSGLGAESARQLSLEKNIDELWLVARRENRLIELSETLSKPTRIFALDVCNPDSLILLEKEMNEQISNGNTLNWLVLAAGLGISGRFDEEIKMEQTINVNIVALSKYARVFLPKLKGNALLFASIAAFLPQPSFSVYAASKSYVLSLSRALNKEFKDAVVTAVCPNPVETEFFLQGGKESNISRIKKIGVEKKEDVIAKAIKKSKKGKDISINSLKAKTIHVFAKIMPHHWILSLGQKVGFFDKSK